NVCLLRPGPLWLKTEGKYKCPCHGSGFTMDGINFEGPAPRALDRLKVVVGPDGQIVVDKSKKFVYEKGQWDDAGSFISV
ncbi:MAG: ubiquinol-cytochrome c reductase iron-sulfur subunit, partial [Nitrospinaceae bacterium]